MQTKLSIFTLAVCCYLFGLYGYSESRASQQAMEKAYHSAYRSSEPTDGLSSVVDNLRVEPRAMTGAVVETPRKEEPFNPVILKTIERFNEDMAGREAKELARMIENTAERYDVDPLLVTALVSQESAFRQDAVSPVGALGLGQLMPFTAADLGVDPFDAEENLDGCVRYLAQQLHTWGGAADQIGLALASYNAGPGAVAKHGGIPPYDETENYVAVISARYNRLLALNSFS